MINSNRERRNSLGTIRPRELGRRLVMLLLALVFTGLYCVPAIGISRDPNLGDFPKFWSSARLLLAGEDIYTPIPITAWGPLPASATYSRPTLHPNLNPPIETVLLAPWGLLPYSVAYIVWSLVGILCAFAAAWLMSHVRSPASKSGVPMRHLLLLLLLYFPTVIAIWYGQFSLVLLLLVTIVWTSARSGRDSLAGAALGLAVSLKIFAALFLLFFLLRRRWRILVWAGAVFVGLTLLAGIIAGPESYVSYFAVLREVGWYSASWNASFAGFFRRLPLVAWTPGGPEPAAFSDLPTYACSVALILLLAWLARPATRQLPEDQFDLAFSFALVAMLLISPLGWMYYFPLLLIVAFVTMRAVQELGCRSCKAVLALAWVLSTVPHFLIPTSETHGAVTVFVWAGAYFYALLLFAGLLAVLAIRVRARLTP